MFCAVKLFSEKKLSPKLIKTTFSKKQILIYLYWNELQMYKSERKAAWHYRPKKITCMRQGFIFSEDSHLFRIRLI